MNEELIGEFRERVEENDFVLHKYGNVNGKNKWNCICSAMDWITVSTHYLCSDRALNITEDEDMNSIEVYTFISCIDVLWESIQQLHRVFFDTSSIPFQEQRKIFDNNQFSLSDNDYFKTIRACFGAHPVNLNDKFNGDKKERRFASWPGSFGCQGDFSVRLYPSDAEVKEDISLDIKFEELWAFAEERYDYLKDLMDTIKDQEIEYVEEMKAIKIEKTENPLEQIDILLREVDNRSENDYYREELNRLNILFSSPINGENNKSMVERYRDLLKVELQEIYENVQNMTFDELERDRLPHGKLPRKYQYPYSSLCESIYGKGYKIPIGINELNEYIKDFFVPDLWKDCHELYTLVEATTYFKTAEQEGSPNAKRF